MLDKRSLQFRIFISYAVFGTAIGLVLFLFLHLSYDQLEKKLIEELLDEEMQFFIQLVKSDPSINSLKTKKLIGYRLSEAKQVSDFPFLDKLDSGIHEINHKHHNYYVKSINHQGERYHILYDVTDFEDTEDWLNAIFITCIVLTILGAVWYGYILGGHVLAPLKKLAEKLKLLPANNLNIQISQEFANDEVGSLAKSFDTYIERMRSFVDREKHFVSDASHELRTPLAVIQGASEMLLATTELNEKDHDKLLRIQRAVTNMSRSISALLILAREPVTPVDPHSTISIADIVNDTIEACRELVDPSRVSIELQILDEPEVAVPDAIVSLLVNNLILNAIRYTPSGKIKVSLNDSQLTVSDTGIGIPQPDIDKIFERGYRGENVSNDGSGLGLSLVKRICDHFGWKIQVSSKQGEGSTVIWLF